MSVRDTIVDLKDRMAQSIIGQENIIERLLIGLLANGNLLVEGLPGLARTRAIKSLAGNLEADFSRIRFTPDNVRAVVHECLRHRLVPTCEANAGGVSADPVIGALAERVAVA